MLKCALLLFFFRWRLCENKRKLYTCRCLFCAGIRTKRSLADYGDDYDDFDTQIGTTKFLLKICQHRHLVT